ncbi:MAG TPA: mersacidin/lichenicidin family type 2 lantibiotic [Ktedonobacteraceae bacterium]|nr:mersacidin/lichenicidin family type 2 lantibiotic [Ktedonobacteraceae bacterium]
MKFDITRESLSEELLPSNPVGELSDAELESAFGGWNGGYIYSKRYEHNESYGLICEVNIFSLSIISNIAILGHVTQACIKG